MLQFARFCGTVLNNPYGIGFLSWCLIFVPIIGMWAVHKYNWEAISEWYSLHRLPVPDWKQKRDPDWWTEYLTDLGLDPKNP